MAIFYLFISRPILFCMFLATQCNHRILSNNFLMKRKKNGVIWHSFDLKWLIIIGKDVTINKIVNGFAFFFSASLGSVILHLKLFVYSCLNSLILLLWRCSRKVAPSKYSNYDCNFENCFDDIWIYLHLFANNLLNFQLILRIHTVKESKHWY